MAKLKYFDLLEAARKAGLFDPKRIAKTFALDPQFPPGFGEKVKTWLVSLGIRLLLRFARTFVPVIRAFGYVWITRHQDVVKVLGDRDTFGVPFEIEMTALGGGVNSTLGRDDAEHDLQRRLIMSVIRSEDSERLAERARHFATLLIKASPGRIDAVRDLITRVATETCAEFMGVKIRDPDAFADWSIAVSRVLFADPYGDPTTREQALYGASRIRDLLARAVVEAKESPTDRHLIGRLVLAREAPEYAMVTNETLVSICIGLIVGFVPTVTLAAGKMLEEILSRPDVLSQACAYAGSSAPDSVRKLEAIIVEAGRLNPALFPGQMRFVRAPEATIGKNRFYATKVRKNEILLAATGSALHDGRAYSRPGAFRTDRQPDPHLVNLMFGDASHACLGKYLALAEITAVFGVLFAQPNCRRAPDRLGKMQVLGPFPRRLDVVFDDPEAPAGQTMVVIGVPITINENVTLQGVQARLRALGNPAGQALTAALEVAEPDIIHFLSLNALDLGDAKTPRPMVLFEISADGPLKLVLETVADRTQALLGPIFRDCVGERSANLADLLAAHVITFNKKPWGSTGLDFAGTREFQVREIARQQRLADFAREALDAYMRDGPGLNGRPMAALAYVRDRVRDGRRSHVAARAGRPVAAGMADDLILPSRRVLAISQWKPRPLGTALLEYLGTPSGRAMLIVIAGLYLVCSVICGVILAIALLAGTVLTLSDVLLGLGGASLVLLSLSGGLVLFLALAGLGAWAFLKQLNGHEAHDIPDDIDPPLEHVRDIAAAENAPGHAQNHIIAMSLLKPGVFRRLTLAISLFVIEKAIIHLFRPGLVLNMGTIHYARWFVPAGTGKLMFMANYDGSWEAYLEDFITRASWGQTAVWGHGVGFPRSRNLIRQGASDGDRFKKWVRRQQRVTQCWYSRFPTLTTDQIRNNAMIHHGLARANTDTAARAWLDCFGSRPRPEYAIETEEVQSLVFSGLGPFQHSICSLITFPDKAKARTWLAAMVNEGSKPATEAYAQPHFGIDFGDGTYGKKHRPTFLAFSADGLERLGMHGTTASDGLSTFPAAFNIGMAGRGRILGDAGGSESSHWLWNDRTVHAALLVYGQTPDDCEAQLGAYLKGLGKEAEVERIVTQPAQPEPLKCPDGVATAQCEPRPDSIAADVLQVVGGPDFKFMTLDAEASASSLAPETTKQDDKPPIEVHREHFGFADGVSQPVIRGTRRAGAKVPDRDIVEPGEFIFGYKANSGYFPPSPLVHPATDGSDQLPISAAEAPGRFPAFADAAGASGLRDFGRNGSFLVIRQMQQHVEEFHDFACEAARTINSQYKGAAVNGGTKVTGQWVAEKMIGRTMDGAALVRPAIDLPALMAGLGRPAEDGPPIGGGSQKGLFEAFLSAGAGHTTTRRQPAGLKFDNDFAFGVDDPQGLACPLGAHIRRANPRDSLLPADPQEQRITNRHRLLRRGRSYETKDEKGLLFMALCGDLERQFEFVQQTWIGSPSFHGLPGERDPLLAQWPGPSAAGEDACPHGGATTGAFTIPTAAGPIVLKGLPSFVTVKAGGYFFLPSRSALRYLANLRD